MPLEEPAAFQSMLFQPVCRSHRSSNEALRLFLGLKTDMREPIASIGKDYLLRSNDSAGNCVLNQAGSAASLISIILHAAMALVLYQTSQLRSDFLWTPQTRNTDLISVHINGLRQEKSQAKRRTSANFSATNFLKVSWRFITNLYL